MKRWPVLLCLQVLGTALVAQQFTARLDANLPVQARLGIYQQPPLPTMPGPATAANTRPAGPITANGSVADSASTATGTVTATTSWTVPTATALGCTINSSFPTPIFGTLGFFPYYGFFDTDVTLTIDGPAGRWGNVVVSFGVYRNERATVDIGFDGSIECDSTSGGTLSFHGGLSREWRVPVQLTGSPLPIRILDTHDTTTTGLPTLSELVVTFVPWVDNSTNLGSTCGQSSTGWIGFTATQYQYALGLHGGSAGAAATAVARGYGPFATFVIGTQAARLPIGSIGLGFGCDDLMSNVLVTTSGQLSTPTPRSFLWSLPIPPLPPGLTLFLQHVSMGTDPIPFQLHFGITNLVEYRT
ncbi:MAG: hypothetical protein MUC36_03355 [Planctomycetes bacterium]|jgi:hypothetical protein|nr:hypothetical protein [Planctomycetota bacterium]